MKKPGNKFLEFIMPEEAIVYIKLVGNYNLRNILNCSAHIFTNF